MRETDSDTDYIISEQESLVWQMDSAIEDLNRIVSNLQYCKQVLQELSADDGLVRQLEKTFHEEQK